MIYDVGGVVQANALAHLFIIAGYLAIPSLVLPYLPLRRHTMIFGVVFFLGCVGSHVMMGWATITPTGHRMPVTVPEMLWHIGQAIGTWGFILSFRRLLTQVARLLAEVEDLTGPPRRPGGPHGGQPQGGQP